MPILDRTHRMQAQYIASRWQRSEWGPKRLKKSIHWFRVNKIEDVMKRGLFNGFGLGEVRGLDKRAG
jgi:hypothetical protein